MDDLLSKIALCLSPGVGAKTARQLVAYCGSPEAVFKTPKRVLSTIPNLPAKVVDAICKKVAFRTAEAECRFVEQQQVKVYFFADQDFPIRLTNIPDAPAILFYKGSASLDTLRTVAVVGTRQPSPIGKQNCGLLLEQLQQYQPLVISGLAYGIDIIAHRKCLELDLATIGVLGHGLSKIYPANHRSIAEKMLEKGGLLTEYPSQLGPEREHFPMRNRIVAAMADSLVVVETARKGGSMITADFAHRYAKKVFAFPGRIQDKMATGCHNLIKEQKAQLLENADDIAKACHWEESREQKTNYQISLFSQLNSQEQELVKLLRINTNMGIDALSHALDLGSGAIAGLLLNLEFMGIVKELPGKHYTLIR